MCLTHDSNPRAACGLKGPFRLVEVVYPHTQTNKQTTWSRPRLQDRSPRDIVVKSYKKQLTYPMLMAPHWTKLADWLEIISPQVMFLFKMLTFPGTSWKSVNLQVPSFRCACSRSRGPITKMDAFGKQTWSTQKFPVAMLALSCTLMYCLGPKNHAQRTLQECNWWCLKPFVFCRCIYIYILI